MYAAFCREGRHGEPMALLEKRILGKIL